MRCRKVRSCLSAYCKDELAGRQLLAVKSHLGECEDCRKQEEFVRVMHQKTAELKGPALSMDFNTKLLNRIGQERFGETRTRAYLPKRAPLVMWRRVVPVLASVAVVAFAIVSMGQGDSTGRNQFFSSNLFGFGGGSYQNCQPTNNPGYAAQLRRDWSLKSQMEQTARLNRLSVMLVGDNDFVSTGCCPSGCLDSYAGRGMSQTTAYFRIRPLLRVYEPNVAPRMQEAGSIY
ncbi:MAG: zf-HC2 domain-containing protein [Candidatus Zixiibacteriota bacterium]